MVKALAILTTPFLLSEWTHCKCCERNCWKSTSRHSTTYHFLNISSLKYLPILNNFFLYSFDLGYSDTFIHKCRPSLNAARKEMAQNNELINTVNKTFFQVKKPWCISRVRHKNWPTFMYLFKDKLHTYVSSFRNNNNQVGRFTRTSQK